MIKRTNVQIREDDGSLSAEAVRLSNRIIDGNEESIIAQIESLDSMAAIAILVDAITNPNAIIGFEDLDPLRRACGLN